MYLFMFLMLTIIGATVLYLSQPQQVWLSKALAAGQTRLIYLLTQVLAIAAAAQVWSALCSLFAWLVLSMLIFSSLPFLSLFRKKS